MAVPLLDLKAQYATIRDSVVNAMTKVIDEQAFILGEPVERLEREVAKLSHTTHAIGCANGTDAILLAMRALDIGRGDEVITTPFTFFATAGTIHNVGATPVFVDIAPDTFNIVPEAAAAARTSRTRAVIPVDLFGQLSAQLPHLAAWSAKRRTNAAFYDAAFADLAQSGALVTPYVAPENESIFNQYTLRIPGGRRDALQAFLKERGIGTSIYYPLP